MCEEEGLMQLRKSTMFVIAFMLILFQMGHGFETNVSMSMSDESRAGKVSNIDEKSKPSLEIL